MMKTPVLFALLALVAVVSFAQGDHVPAYNDHPMHAGDALPILPKDQLWGEAFQYPYQVQSYELAAKIPGVLYRLPCYCYCERIGHNSLHTCFESTHGAHCAICMKEVFYAYKQTKAKKTPAQIRAGIVKGEWKSIDLESETKSN